MGDAGEISVELRLKTTKLAGDIKKGAAQVQNGLTSDPSKVWGVDPAESKKRQANKDKWADIARATKEREEAMLARNALRKPPVMQSQSTGAGGALGALQGHAGNIGGIAAAAGIPGGASIARLAAAAGPAAMAIAAVGASMLALRSIMNRVNEAMDNARRLYAKQLMSGGLPGGFVQKRASLAEVIGVSEEQVYSYGTAVGYLNGKLSFANQVITRTNPQLTATAWEFKVMEQNIRAMFAALGESAAPMLRNFAQAISGLMNVLTIVINSPQFKLMMTLAEFQTGGFFLRLFGDTSNQQGAPTPGVSTNRLTTSSFERMGLVIGAGGNSGWQAQTAKNTRATVDHLRTLIDIMPRSTNSNPNVNSSSP